MSVSSLTRAANPGYKIADLVYVPIAVFACFLAALVARRYFLFDYTATGVLLTAALLAPALVLFGPAYRNRFSGGVFTVALCMLVLLSHVIKISAMKSPILATDLLAVPLLIRTLSGKYVVWGIGLISCIAILVFGCFRFRARSLPATFAAFSYLIALVLTATLWVNQMRDWAGASQMPSLGQRFEEAVRVDEQLKLLQLQGGLLYLLSDWRAMREDVGYIPKKEEIAALKPHRWTIPTGLQRNIHIVLLESIWDASALDGVEVTGFDPRFEALWAATGRTYALSPVIGGATANAEFEVLCGLVAPPNSVAFLDNLKNTTPCLPAVLQKMGYKTIASHPHKEGNWNRAQAYARIGFQRFHPISAFELDDMEGPFLSDASLFRQNAEFLKQIASHQATFNYVVSLSSHWGYPRDKAKRPDVVAFSEAGLQVLPQYLNASFYTTKAFMDWMAVVMAQDPDALIVVFGDHAPVLDTQPDVYKRLNNKVTGSFESDALRRQIGIARVPMIIVDGENGPVKFGGELPLFELPARLSQLLGRGALLPQVEPQSTIVMRPMFGQLMVAVDGHWTHCGTLSKQRTTSVCARAWERHVKQRLVRQDIIAGKQYFLSIADADAAAPAIAGMLVSRQHHECEFEVKAFGPHEAIVGTPFYPHGPDLSTVWISFDKLRGTPTVKVGEFQPQTVQGERLITAALPTAVVTRKATVLPITLQCDGQTARRIGELIVR